MGTTPVYVTVIPGSGRYDEDDERWLGQVAHLRRELTDEVGVGPPAPGRPGTKGPATELVLALGTSGAITAAVELVRLFLARDQTRTVDLVWTDTEGREHRAHASATHASADVLDPFVESVSRQVAHP